MKHVPLTRTYYCRYENERLKKMLVASGENAQKWDSELKALKNQNVRLKTALQDSAANVEIWKKQLMAWKNRVKDLEVGLPFLPPLPSVDISLAFSYDLQFYRLGSPREVGTVGKGQNSWLN